MLVIVLILCLLVVVGGLPTWGYHSYGLYPSGLGGLLFVIILIVLLTRRL